MINIGDIHPGFSCVEIGMDGKPHETALWPGGDAGGEVFVAVHVENHPAPFVAGMDLVDLIVMRGGDPQGVIGTIDDFPGRVHSCRTRGRIQCIDLKGLIVPGYRGLSRQ